MARPFGIPLAPLLLGLGGLLPFAALSGLVLLGGSRALGIGEMGAFRALVTYGAVIASFLGGIRWGVAVRDEARAGPTDYVLSVVPPLVAWAILALPPPSAALGLAVLIGGWGALDQDLPKRGLAPPWFGALRALLSGGAALALAVAWWASS